MKPIDHEPIYKDGKHYDKLNTSIADLPFYFDAIEKYGDPILELACGTGRITIPIAEKGYDIVGIDISQGMINEAKSKLSGAKLKLDFFQEDIRKFDINKKFSLIILPFNSICHLHDLESILSCFNSVMNHLTSEGRFIIDVFKPSFKHLLRNIDQRTDVKEYNLNGKKVKLTETNFYNQADQINYIKWYFEIDGKENMEELNMRMFYPQELDNYLILAGFKIENKYGDFNKSEFTSNSEKQIIICKTN